MKNLSLFLVLVTLVITPVRVNAMFERAGDEKGKKGSGSDETDRNSTTAENQSAKEQAEIGGGSSSMSSGDDSEEEVAVQHLVLQDFRDTLAANPSAECFVIVEEEGVLSIQPREVLDGNREENLAVINALRNALGIEGSPERAIVGEFIGQNNLLNYHNSHLTATRLRSILSRLDAPAVQAERVPITPFHKQVVQYIIAADKRLAEKAYEEGKPQVADAYHKKAQAHEQQVQAARGDEKTLIVQGGISAAQRNAASAYEKAAKADINGNNQAFEAYCEAAWAYGQQAEALARGDKKTAGVQKEIAAAHSNAADAASAYEEAAKADVNGNNQAVEAHRRVAWAYGRQAEALALGDREAADEQKKIAID